MLEVQNNEAYEDSVNALTCTLLAHYFPPADDWVIGAEQTRDGGKPDFLVYRTPYEHTWPREHVIIECKKRGESFENAINQLSLVGDTLRSNDPCYAIVVVGTLIGFFEFYNKDVISSVTMESCGTVDMKSPLFFGGMFPMIPPGMDIACLERMGVKVIFWEEGGYMVGCFWDMGKVSHENHIHNLFRIIATTTIPLHGVFKNEEYAEFIGLVDLFAEEDPVDSEYVGIPARIEV
jgi:hypothetical protein